MMLSHRPKMMESSSRILDAYVAGLRAEVARLQLVREHSRDVLWVAQLDLQIDLKMQLIADVTSCLGDDEEENAGVDIEFDSMSGMTSVPPSIS